MKNEGMVIKDPNAFSLPALDNGQWLWSLYTLIYLLKKSHDKTLLALADAYDSFLTELKQDLKTVFFDEKSKCIRMEVIIQTHSKNCTTYAAKDDNYLSDMHEGIMMVLFALLFASGLDEEDKKKLWDSVAAVAEDTDYGPVYKGWPDAAKAMSNPHTKWAFLFLPLLDNPIADDIYQRQEKLRMEYSQQGFCASVTYFDQQSKDYKYIEHDPAINAPYGVFPLLFYFAQKNQVATKSNSGLHWLYQMLSVEGMFGEYGAAC